MCIAGAERNRLAAVEIDVRAAAEHGAERDDRAQQLAAALVPDRDDIGSLLAQIEDVADERPLVTDREPQRPPA